jgi:hypothetical protein
MATLFSDNFNRANEQLTVSANWQLGENASASEATVTSNRLRIAEATAGPTSVRTTTTAHAAVADCKTTITRITGSGYDGGPTVRATASNTFYYLDAYGTNNIEVYRRVSGADTLVGTRNQTHAANDTFTLEVSGTGATVTLKVYRNGVQVSTDLSDTSGARITGAGQCGVMSWVTGNQDYDDFLVEDLAGGGGGGGQPPRSLHQFRLRSA